MTKLPTISGEELIKILVKRGYYIRGQRGSHVQLRHPAKLPITIPNHKEISKGTLKEILRVTGLSIADLTD